MEKRWLCAVSSVLLFAAPTGCRFDPGGINTEPLNLNNAYECDCTCGTEKLPVNATVTSSSDDAEQFVTGAMRPLNDAHIHMTRAGGSPTGALQLVGVRFQNITIPAGS